MGNGHGAVLLSRNHGRGPGSLDLGPHVARVVGPVCQHGLVGAQVAHEQARRLRVVTGLPPVRARAQMRPCAAQFRGSLVMKPPQLRPGGRPQGLPFFGPRPATWCARTAVESTISRCKPVAFYTCASTWGQPPACRQQRHRA